ncbi:MAG: DNA polymerase III subunit psi [Gammaproteobacteria bacterium]|nr:DNA polymerase III subunit psi [Gammaproteobacteria bacterium]
MLIQKTSYLQAMGITYWHQRGVEAVITPCWQVDLAPVLILIETQFTAAEKELLEAILKALNCAAANIDVVAENNFVKTYSKVIVFGKAVSEMIDALTDTGSQLIQLPSLVELINKPELKRSVWEQLKPLKPLLQVANA